jgi:hypothetical protein
MVDDGNPEAVATWGGSWDPWWFHDDVGPSSDAANQAFSELHRIEALEVYRRECNRNFVRYYGDPRYNGFSTVGITYPSPNVFDESRSNENIIREVLTTLHNKFGKARPVPTIVTTGGSYKDQSEAELRENWVRGVFEEDKVYDQLSQAQFLSMVFGDGFIGVRDDYDIGRPTVYTFPSYEVHLDPVEGQYEDPRSLYRVSSVPKEWLAARYPEHAQEIWRATPFFEELWNIRLWNSEARTINFLECWHRPSKPGAKDGKHLIALPQLALVNEPWDCDYFPVVRIRWNPRPFGYFSVGLVEDLIPPQRAINKTRQAIDEHLQLISSSFWAVQRGSQIVKSHLSNLIGRVMEYTTVPPELKTPSPVSPDLWNQQEKLREQIFAQSGVSQLAAASMKPAGLNSSKALRTYADQEDARFVNAQRAKEDAVVDLANLLCKRAQAMFESDKDPKLLVKLVNRSELSAVQWKDTDLDSYRARVLPSSSLATTLAGKIEDVEDLESLGLIENVEQKKQLLQMPDLEADNNLSLAPRKLILQTLQENILNKGESIIPEPYWDLNLCSQLGLQVLCFAQLKKYPEDRIQLLQNWVNECAARLTPPPPPPMPPTNGGPMTPPGMSPGMPPPSGPPPIAGQ